MGNRKNLPQHGNLKTKPPTQHAKRFYRKKFAPPPTLALANPGVTNAGNYAVVISSPYGSVTSAVATLTIVSPPAVITQPASQFAVVGGSLNFSLTATGTQPLN